MIQHAHAWKIHIITVSPLPQCFMARGEVLLRILGEHPTFGGDAPHRQVWTPWQHEGNCQRWTSDRGQQEKWQRCSFSSSNDAEHSRTSNIGTLCSIEHRNELNILIQFFWCPFGKRICHGFPAALWLHLGFCAVSLPSKTKFRDRALAKRRCDGCWRGKETTHFEGEYLRSQTFFHSKWSHPASIGWGIWRVQYDSTKHNHFPMHPIISVKSCLLERHRHGCRDCVRRSEGRPLNQNNGRVDCFLIQSGIRCSNTDIWKPANVYFSVIIDSFSWT